MAKRQRFCQTASYYFRPKLGAFFRFIIVAVAVTTVALVMFKRSSFTVIFERPPRPIQIKETEILESFSFQCNNKEPKVKEISEPFSALVVQTCGNIIDRIRQFNVALESIRIQKLKTLKNDTDWKINAQENLTLLGEWKDDYFHSLSRFPQVTLIILPWLRKFREKPSEWSSLHDASNLPVHEYYESTASEPLCTWIETPGMVGFSFDVINNWTCNRNTTKAVSPQSISLLALNAKAPYEHYYYPSIFPEHFFTDLPSILYSFHIVETGVINIDGDVFIKNAKIVPYGCFPETTLNSPPDVDKFPIYDEVLVITQRFGVNNYHRLAETFPRIAVLVDFLMRNPNIRIHTPTEFYRISKYLTMLGIDSNRIIYSWCRAKVVYLPRAVQCTFPSFFESQLLSRLFRRYIRNSLSPGLRNKVIVIRRSNHRYFHEQDRVEEVVRKAATDYNFTYETFRDAPLPSMEDMMRLFHSAVMVVAPHGAGLGNLVFSQPGTFLVEGVCNPPTAFLFFQRTALIFGHRYHGIPSTGGCFLAPYDSVRGQVTIEPSEIDKVVRIYLNSVASRTVVNSVSAEIPL